MTFQLGAVQRVVLACVTVPTATLETGLNVQVPLFIENGERVKVDTRSGEYLSRA